MPEGRKYEPGERVPTIAGLTERLKQENTPFKFYDTGRRVDRTDRDPIVIDASVDSARWYAGVHMMMRPLIIDPEEGIVRDEETGSKEIKGHTVGFDGKSVTPYVISLSPIGNQLLVGEELYPLALNEDSSYLRRA
jgi:hypothetical protein